MKKSTIHILVSFVIAVILMIFEAKLGWYYSVDNQLQAMIVDGVYSNSEGYCIFLNPVLCKIINTFQKVFYCGDAYTICIAAVFFAASWSLIYCIFKYIDGTMGKIVFLEIFFLLEYWGADGVRAQFTQVACYMTFAGCIMLFLAVKEKNGWSSILGTVYVLFGLMIRKQVAMLFVPFLLLMFFTILVGKYMINKENPQEWLKEVIKRWGIAVVCVGILLCIDSIWKNSVKYEDAMAYNQARAAIQDFPILEWSENEAGISRNDLALLKNWMQLDTEIVTTSFLEKAEENFATKAYEYSIKGVCGATVTMVATIVREEKLIFLYFFLSIVLLIGILKKRENYKKIALICSYGGGIHNYFILYYFGQRNNENSCSCFGGFVDDYVTPSV